MRSISTTWSKEAAGGAERPFAVKAATACAESMAKAGVKAAGSSKAAPAKARQRISYVNILRPKHRSCGYMNPLS